MIYSNLKSGDLRISRVSIGGNIFGHFADEVLTANILDCAKENGINFIDTSDTYSCGLSEKYIGKAIRSNRSRWIVATKCGLESHQSSNGLGRRSLIYSKVNQSLKRLKTDYLDIYQMHNFDPITPIEETVEALERCVSEGKIRYYGVSNYSLIEISSFHDQAKILNSRHFLSAQYPFNLLKGEAKNSIFPWCSSNEIAIFVYGALARGLLSGKYLRGNGYAITKNTRAFNSESVRSDINPATLPILRALEIYSGELNITLSQLAIKYILSKPSVATAIVGFRNIFQLKELVAVVDSPIFQDEILNKLENMCLSIDSEELHLGGILRV